MGQASTPGHPLGRGLQTRLARHRTIAQRIFNPALRTLLGYLLAVAASHAAPTVTFNKDIAPIVFDHCAACHRPGGAGPFSLLHYQDAHKRARQIAAVTRTRYMPPWLPDPGPVHFAGEWRLTNQQIALIERWVEQGAAEGRASDLPRSPQFASGWQLGKPDLVLTLPKAYTLPAEGTDVYRNFIFPFALAGKHYVRALEIRPGNARVVHHANLLIDRTRSVRWRDGQDGQPGFPGMDLNIAANPLDPESHFLFWKPGSVIAPEPPGMSWTVEQGTDLVLNVHLQPSGKPEPVQPSLGLYFTDRAPAVHPMLIQLEHDSALDIPAGASAFTVTDDFVLPVAVDVLGVYPHAHYLGKEVEGIATLPGGARISLIHIQRWDLKWQAVYRYAKPVALPKGTKISMRWVYDNSAANPANPNHPPQRVVGGDRATDEMAHLWLQVLPRAPAMPDPRLIIEEALIRKRVRSDPADFAAHFNLGGILQSQGNLDGAIAELRRAVEIRPHSEIALNALGAYLQMAGKPDDAAICFRNALAARPGYPDAHFNLAVLLLARGEQNEAIVHLREVVRLDQADAKARSLLSEALNARARALAGGGQLTSALADFREIVALDPTNAGAITNLGTALAMHGEKTEAAREFERALQIDPHLAAAQRNLQLLRRQR